MAVLSVNRIFENSSGRSMDEQGRVTRTATEIYQVLFDASGGNGPQAEQAAGVPHLGAALSGDSTRRVVNVVASQRDESTRKFHVTVTYSTRGRNDTEVEDPLARPPEVNFDIEETREPTNRDEDGKAIVTSAREPIDPPLEGEVETLLMTYTRNEASFNAPLAIDYWRAVNSDTFGIYGGWTIDPGQAKIRGITGAQQFENGTNFFRVTYRVAFRPYHENNDGNIYSTSGVLLTGNLSRWLTFVTDQGLYELNDDGEQVRIRDVNGTNIVTPRLLDGQGAQLAASDTLARFIAVRQFPIRAFGPLNLT